jgi:hypothetical protein
VLIEFAEVLALLTHCSEALAYLDGTTFATNKAQAALPELRAGCLDGMEQSDEAVRMLEPLLQVEVPTPRLTVSAEAPKIDSREQGPVGSLVRNGVCGTDPIN